jgi:O-acetyl-ADP-ribose deacetylase (regulator of RNase III)
MPQSISRMTFPSPAGERVFEAVIGDLLGEPVDAICNAANGGLSHGGGVAALISEAAGPALDRECDEIVRTKGRVPTGGAVVTTAGRLPFKAVIHVVGPRLGDGAEEAKLVQALKAAFVAAGERSFRSVSFPAVSSGIFSVPLPVCARAYVRAAREFFAEHPDSSVKALRLALFKGPIVDAVRREMGAVP